MRYPTQYPAASLRDRWIHFISLLCSCLFVFPASAQIDANSNGLSDEWEKSWNNNSLFPPTFDPQEDYDGDGWKNIMESTAGTDPYQSQPPTGIIAADIAITPATYEPPPLSAPFDPLGSAAILLDPPLITLTWPTIAGKTYRAHVSENLLTWQPTSETFLGSGIHQTYETQPLHTDGTVPENLFWRIETGDTDSDGDTLTDYEEIRRNLDPFSLDSDGDGDPDNTDPAPLSSSLQLAWDADSANPATGTALFASFNFTPLPGGTYPATGGQVTDITGNIRHGTARALSGLYQPQNPPMQNAEGISGAGFHSAGIHNFAFAKKTPSLSFNPVSSLSFWLKTNVADLANAGQPIFSYIPQGAVFGLVGGGTHQYAIRASLRKQATTDSYEIVWRDWQINSPIRERWALDLTKFQLDNQWVNLTFVWQGNGTGQNKLWACYANGIKQNRTLGTPSAFLNTISTSLVQDTFLIGADATGGPSQNNLATVGSTFKGSFDRVRFYTTSLSPAHVTAISSQDTDADGLWDSTEASASMSNDTNSNGRRDQGEIRYPNVNPQLWQPPSTDTDRDGLTDITEQNITRTLLFNPDTDGDLIPDGWENQNALNPLSATDSDGTTGDPDADGVDNFDEWRFLSKPFSADSDGDGVSDRAEIDQGSNPNKNTDSGQAPPPEEKRTLKILVGDPSGSHSERWRIEVEDVSTGQIVLRHASRLYGEMSTPAQSTFPQFKVGKAYRFKLRHVGTKPELLKNDTSGQFYPDYDWALEISYKDAQGTFIDITSPSQSEYLVLDPYKQQTKTLSEIPPKLLATEQEYASVGEGTMAKPAYQEKIEAMSVIILPLAITPDFDRDGSITEDDKNKATPASPVVMWINDNNSANPEPHRGDIPGSGADNADQMVNGIRDLIDFFPYQLHLIDILEFFPAKDYKYSISHPTGAYNFLEMPATQPSSQASGNGAGAYLANPTAAADALRARLKPTTGEGTRLSALMLSACAADSGILLIEAKSTTTQPPTLTIEKKTDPSKKVTIACDLKTTPKEVEQLYWRVNIRGAPLGGPPAPIIPPTDAAVRDSRKDRWFVFCHGYNVDSEAARGWNAETFKRLHHKGSNARFVGVSWEGNQGQLGGLLSLNEVFSPDYWRNAYNAFASSSSLKSTINTLTSASKSKTVIAAHSMGNLLASSAICDHGLLAEKYFLLNAAVAREAYDPIYIASDRTSVRHPDWNTFPTRLWSSDWFFLFPNDARKTLTWQGRFGNITSKTTPHNYFSSTEDVLANGESSEPRATELLLGDTRAWIKQEMSKGRATKAFVTGTVSDNWSSNGGWAFNPNHYQAYRPGPLPDTSAITDAQLRTNPFFKPFTKLSLVNGGAVPDSTNGIDIAGPNGAAHAAEYSIRAWLLSHDVPAISNPAGRNLVFSTPNSPAQDTDLNTLKAGNWGAWKHSDMKKAPMIIVGKLYEKLVERGNLK